MVYRQSDLVQLQPHALFRTLQAEALCLPFISAGALASEQHAALLLAFARTAHSPCSAWWTTASQQLHTSSHTLGSDIHTSSMQPHTSGLKDTQISVLLAAYCALRYVPMTAPIMPQFLY